MRRFGAALGLAVVLGAGVGAPQARALPNPALAAPTARPAELPDRVWRVGVFEAPPYAMRSANGEWNGLIVDLWKELASELNLQYRFGEASPDTILDDVAHNRLDVAAAPFASTIEREKTLDFSHAFMVQEMGIAVRKNADAERWLYVARALATPTALRLYFGLVGMVFVAGIVLWLLERRRNPQFSGNALQGMGSGIWWSGVTTVAVGYGDKVPITFWGRLVALLWMSVSLILITAFTAFVTAKLAVAEFGRINGPDSLHNATVGTVQGAAVAEYLRQQRIHHRIYATMPKALQGLRDGEVGAVVYGARILEYYVARDPAKDLEVLPATFDHQNLGFPLPDGSPLRDPINTALRRYLAQTAWRDLQDRYFVAPEHVDQ